MKPALQALVLSLLCSVAALPVPAGPDEKAAEIEKLIRQLGNDDFDIREEATAKLTKLGEAALPALKTAAKENPDVEVKQRAAALIARIEKANRADLLTIQGQTSGYWLNRIAFTKDGKQAIATGGGVIWFDLETGKELNRTLEKQFARPALALSKDGRYFATGHQNDNDVYLGEVAKGKDVGTCKGHTAGVWAVAFSPDGSQVVSGSDDKTMRLWDFKTVKELHPFDHGKYKVHAVEFSPDGKQIASGTAGGNEHCPIYLWDVKSGKQVQTFKGHRLDVTAVHFTPDGKRLLSSGRDGLLILWDVESGKELKRMEHGVRPGSIYSAAISPDGKRALTAGFGDHMVRLWDLEKGKEIKKFEGHPGAVLGVAFSPDGKRALSSDSQKTIKLWKLPEFRRLCRVESATLRLKRKPHSRGRSVAAPCSPRRTAASSAAETAVGFSAATFSKARAGPSGRRRPCSQFCKVETLTPIMRANSLCDFPNRCRMAFTSSGAISLTRLGLASPRRMAPACRTLSTRFSKSSFFIRTPRGLSSGPGCAAWRVVRSSCSFLG